MTLATLLAAVSVAFPQEGQRLPILSRCYVIGATDGAEPFVRVAGVPVPVHRTGAWATAVDVVPGLNALWVGGKRHSFFVGPGAHKSPSASAARSAKTPAPATRPSRAAAVSRNGGYGKLPYAADVAKPHPRGKRPSAVTIVVDAGHGGEDAGALSPHALPEKDANLRLARDVEAHLKARGFRVVMTRTDDSALALYDRPKVAHQVKADAFVSIHHNAPGYATNPAGCRYQAVYSWNALGDRLAKAVVRRLAAARPSLPSKGVVRANYAVTRNPEIPSCLVEADFVTHPEGESAIWDASCREVAAAAIADGIADWLAER